MKNIIRKPISIILAIAVLLSINFVASGETVNTVGNTAGNFSNGSFAAFQGDFIYYRSYYGSKLYKASLDGTTKQVLCNDKCGSLNVVGDWIYYLNLTEYRIYKIKTDGTLKTKVSEKNATFLQVVDDWMYFGSSNLSTYSIIRMKTDGTEQAVLANYIADFFNVVDNVIYFGGKVNHDANTTIYSMNTDGSNLKQIVSTEYINIDANYYSGYIYFSGWSWNGDGYSPGKIHRIKTDGSDDTILSEDSCSTINVYNNKIYYVNSANKYTYKINLDGTEKTLLADTKSGYISVNNDDVYIESEQLSSLYTMKSDGTNFKTLITISEPKGLDARSTSYNTIKLTWYCVYGASGYSIYRYNGTQYTEIADLSTVQNVETQTYLNSGLTFNTKYSYKIKAYIKIKDGVKQYSGFSNQSYATTTLAVPTLYSVNSYTYCSLKLSWSSVVGATGYTVYKLVNKNYIAITNSTTLTFVDNNLVTGTTYYYKVNAYRTISGIAVYSGFSYVFSASPILNVPGNFGYSRTNTGLTILKWSAVAGASGYTLYKEVAGTYNVLANLSTLSYTEKALISDSLYRYKIAAYRIINGKKIYSVLSSSLMVPT